MLSEAPRRLGAVGWGTLHGSHCFLGAEALDGTQENSARRAGQASQRASSGPAVGLSRAGKGRRTVTPRLSCPSQHGACRCCRRLVSAEKHSMAAAAPARRVCGRTGAPSAHTGRCASQHLLHPPGPHPSPLGPSACSLDATAGVKPERPRGPCRPGVTRLPGPWWWEASHPCGESPLCSVLPGLQPELQSSSPARSPGGAVS